MNKALNIRVVAYSNSPLLVKTNALLGQTNALWTKKRIEKVSKAELLEFGAFPGVQGHGCEPCDYQLFAYILLIVFGGWAQEEHCA